MEALHPLSFFGSLEPGIGTTQDCQQMGIFVPFVKINSPNELTHTMVCGMKTLGWLPRKLLPWLSPLCFLLPLNMCQEQNCSDDIVRSRRASNWWTKERCHTLAPLTLIIAHGFCSAWGGQEMISSIQRGALVRIRIISWCIFKHLFKHQATQQLWLNELCVNWDHKGGLLGGTSKRPTFQKQEVITFHFVYPFYKCSFIIFLWSCISPGRASGLWNISNPWEFYFLSLKFPIYRCWSFLTGSKISGKFPSLP